MEEEKKQPAPLSEEEKAEQERKKRAEEHFVEGVLTRGEAAKPQQGKLPPGATHEIVEEKEGEQPKIRRRRFSTTGE
ncbi:hypothetical protein KSF_110970 [Reticulibacter mediterranei]|uniref:Uncharacterized protein n=1 Tax=Reticulibacter mediterranei TaxID=2778369 RepID=A0A8J3N7B8_9CHLR|nr:hypothetical protein [Reticulibacter mediterranei]GHP01050.1 hypothetical protein KSF_110970 [Reticulibacter mediterranei]